MSERLEDRLTSLLGAEAELLPPASNHVGPVLERGRQRRNRARVVGAGSLLAVAVAAAGLGGGALTALRPEPTETVAVDGGQRLTTVEVSSESDVSSEIAVRDGNRRPDPTLPQPPIVTIEPGPVEPPEPTTTPPPETTITLPPSATSTSSRSLEPPDGRRSTDDVVGALSDNEILFFSNGDGCRGIDDGQAHPDWVEGQPDGSSNSDGTPTYGFAYNTGDSVRGEISWGFKEESIALSGECVLEMGLAEAYDEKRAVRIFRRYDRNGRDLPSDGYYSIWFYFPEEISYDGQANIDGETVYGFWNVFQIKNKIRGLDGANETFSALSVNAGKLPGDESMSFHLWSKAECGRIEDCQTAGPINQLAEPLPIPVGEWVHLELHLVSRSERSGRIEMWQDGLKVFDYTGITERAGTDRLNWSVNSYGRLHRPATHELYADDALISTRPIHPLLFD